MDSLFPIKPLVCLLHGDFHRDNWGYSNNKIYVFDPTPLYGHNEYELASMDCFYMPTKEFIDTYHTIIPKNEKLYIERKALYHSFILLIGYLMSNEENLLKRAVKNMKSLLNVACDYYPSLTPTNKLLKLSPTLPNALIIMAGSFCPIHKNHIDGLDIALNHLQSTFNIIGTYIAPTSDHHLERKLKHIPFNLNDRVNMINEVIPSYANLDMSTLGWPNYHTHFEQLLNDYYGNNDVTIIILHGQDGADYYKKTVPQSFIEPRYKIVCLGRNGYAGDSSELIPNLNEKRMSSTTVRDLLHVKKYNDLCEYLDDKVIKYIETNPITQK